MPKCDFNKVASNFTEIALRHGCSPVNLLYIFRTSFPRNTSGWQFLTVICIHSKLLIISTFDKDFDLKNTSSRWLGNIVHNISMSSSSLSFFTWLIETIFLWTFLIIIEPICSQCTFLYSLKTSENLKVFWCFQKVEKGCIGNKWFNLDK